MVTAAMRDSRGSENTALRAGSALTSAVGCHDVRGTVALDAELTRQGDGSIIAWVTAP
ncbi:hypothetical protein GCM10027517_03850 [Phycicoccus ginsengisoli]